MSKRHDQKPAVAITMVGALAGGLAVYGAMWLGRRLAAYPGVRRVARFVALVVSELAAPSEPAIEEHETVFQAEPETRGVAPAWTAPGPRPVSPYGPN
jgi:hypothetical protein